MKKNKNDITRRFKLTKLAEFIISSILDRWVYAIIGGGIFLLFLFVFGGTVNKAPVITGFAFFLSMIVLIFTGRKLHWDALITIISFGLLFSVITPILDTPDETAHLARAMYLIEGKFTVSNLDSQLLISEDYDLLHDQQQKTIIENDLNIHDSNVQKVESDGLKATNAYSFISYIPQAAGIGFGRLVDFSVLWSFYLGRMTNLLVYAVLICFAIKITPLFKNYFFVVGTIPMGVYIAASYNQDAFGIGVIFITIAFFLHLLNKEEHTIRIRDVVVYTAMCMLITLTKFPFVLLILLLVFIPSEQFEKKCTHKLIFLLILITAAFSLVWMKTYSSIPHPFLPEGVNMKEQIKFLISTPIENFQLFMRNLLEGITNYLMLFNFGWLSYSSNGVGFLYLFFLGSISIFFPKEILQRSRTRLGSFIIMIGIYTAIELSMYLTWTPVGSTIINGVQGRYFIGFLPLIPLALNIGPGFDQINKIQKKQYDVITTIVPIYFIIVSLAFTLGQYYS